VKRALLVTAFVAAACHETPPGATDAPAASSSAHVTAPSAAANVNGLVAGTLGDAIAAIDLRIEAVRGLASASDALLVKHKTQIDAHFAKAPAFPLAFQVVPVDGGKAAVLLEATLGEPRPLIWLLDAHGEILWSKDHPNGGASPGSSELVITPGPEGHVCVAWCNGSTSSIAFRRWAEDGGSFADYDALRVDDCDALSVLYWPAHGWVLGVASASAATLELLDLNGERRWGHDGLSLPWTWSSAAPVSFALDTSDSLMMFRLGQSGGTGTPQYVFASRWSPDGRPMWPGPLSLKRLSAPVSVPRTRVILRPASEGGIRASVQTPAALGNTGPGVVVDVLSDGTITRR
jgi:hypothetical protein